MPMSCRESPSYKYIANQFRCLCNVVLALDFIGINVHAVDTKVKIKCDLNYSTVRHLDERPINLRKVECE